VRGVRSHRYQHECNLSSHQGAVTVEALCGVQHASGDVAALAALVALAGLLMFH